LIGLEKDINRYRILFFIFDLEYLIRVLSSEPLQCKKESNLLLVWITVACAQTEIFSGVTPNRAPKIRGERHQLFFGLQLPSKELQHPVIQIKIEKHFGGFFHQMKVRQPIGRQDSKQTVTRTSRRFDLFLHEAAQNFEVFSNIQE
jgi:hypothetical protein